jgi:hypothetical protein
MSSSSEGDLDMRYIDEFEIVSGDNNYKGIVAKSNDGKLYRFNLFQQGADWVPLPDLPQDNFEHPMERELGKIQKLIPQLINTFQGELGSMMEMLEKQHHLRHHAHGAEVRKCPVQKCEYLATSTSDLTSHLEKTHPDRQS